MTAIFTGIDGYFVIGTSNLQVQINITKSGDPSYGSVFYMVYPDYLGYSKVKTTFGDEVSCSPMTGNLTTSALSDDQDTSATDDLLELTDFTSIKRTEHDSVLVCSFGNPLKVNAGVSVNIELTVPVFVTEESFRISLTATTQSNETNGADNTATTVVHMKHHVSLSIDG